MSVPWHRVSKLAQMAQSQIKYSQGRELVPIQSYLIQKICAGQTQFFLPRSFISRTSFDLQPNHQKMITWLKDEGWEVDLHQYHLRGCLNWMEKDPSKQVFVPVYQTSIFVRLK